MRVSGFKNMVLTSCILRIGEQEDWKIFSEQFENKRKAGWQRLFSCDSARCCAVSLKARAAASLGKSSAGKASDRSESQMNRANALHTNSPGFDLQNRLSQPWLRPHPWLSWKKYRRIVSLASIILIISLSCTHARPEKKGEKGAKGDASGRDGEAQITL